MEETTIPPAAPPLRRGLLYPCMLLLCGMGLIAVAASMDAGWIAGKPWSAALLVLDDDDENIPPGAHEVYAYPVVTHSPSEGDTIREMMRQFADAQGQGGDFKLNDETAVAVVMSVGEAAPLLASGRLPRPGAREALAGDLVPEGYFTLRCGEDTVQFDVVGRLKRTVSGFTNSYLIVDDPAIEESITPDDDARPGWLVPDGWDHFDQFRPWIGKNDPEVGGSGTGDEDYGPDGEGDDGDGAPEMGPMNPDSPGMEPAERPQLFAEPELTPLSPKELGAKDEKYAGVTVVQRQIRVPADIFWTTLAGLIMVAAAGYSMATRICLRRSPASGGLLGPLFREIARRRRLWGTLHSLLYILFFYAMIAGFVLPEANYQVVQYVSGIFSKSGDLGYIGDAYASGDIVGAALATFNNNYIIQTLGMTMFISLLGIPAGAIKTAGSFLLAGLALSPIWVDGASGYVFHSVTMAMEFEGYIIACFAVLVWALCAYRALVRSGSRMGTFFRGVQMLACFLLATGIYGASLAVVGVLAWVLRVLGVLSAHDGRKSELAGGIRLLFAAALASGLVLAVAALYEAVTLILLVRGSA